MPLNYFAYNREDDSPRGGHVLLPYEYLSIPSQPITRVVITGGPCSGKTTGLRYFKQELEKLGYIVFCLPEVATMLMQGGARLWLTPEEQVAEQEAIRLERMRKCARRERFPVYAHERPPHGSTTPMERLSSDPKREVLVAGTSCPSSLSTMEDERRGGGKGGILASSPLPHDVPCSSSSSSSVTCTEKDAPSYLKELLQRRVLQNMIVHEDSFGEISRALHQPVVILMDRGALDGCAYCTSQEWQRVLLSTHFSEEELVESRYEVVMHFVTAADGAASHYSLANNTTRHESVEEAIQQDVLTRRAWRSFPFVITIPNESGRSFEEKIQHGLAELRRLLPSPLPLSPRCDSMVRRTAWPALVEKEVQSALLHTGSVFFASTSVAGISAATQGEGVQRFMVVEEVDWEVLMEGTRGSNPWVTEKRICQFFFSPVDDEEEEESVGSGPERGGTRRKLEKREGTNGGGACGVEQFIRIEGHAGGVHSRPLYLRHARVRGRKVPPIMHLRSSSSTSTTLISAEEKGGEANASHSDDPLTFDAFDYTCPLTAEAFTQRVCAATPVLPPVEKKVYRFFHERLHLQVLQFFKGGWTNEEVVQKALRGAHVAVAGPVSLTPEKLPKWLKVGPKAYEESWVSKEIIL